MGGEIIFCHSLFIAVVSGINAVTVKMAEVILRLFPHRMWAFSWNNARCFLIASMMLALMADGCGSANRKFSVLNEAKKKPEISKDSLLAPGGIRTPIDTASLTVASTSALDTTDDADTVSEDPGDLIADARLFCSDSNYAAADSLLHIAVKTILVIDAQGQSDRFPTSRYIDDIIAIYDEKMPKTFSLPDEIAASVFQGQVGRSLDSIKIPSSDSASIAALGIQDNTSYDIPMVWNNKVRRAILFYVKNRKNTIDKWFPSASRYLPSMRQMFADSGLPQDLAYLPLIESAFNPMAYSCARAAGIWQFIASTGSLYGLQRSYWIDERHDPIRSTQAAVTYLKKLYGDFGDWYLALAAYNCGENGVKRSIARCNTQDYWKLRLPAQTKGYVPTFLAAVTVAKNPHKFSVPVLPGDSLLMDTVLLNDCIRLDDIAQGIGIPCDSLKKLNPHILRWCTPPDATNAVLYLPAGYKASFESFYAMLPEEKKVKWCHYQIKRTDNLQKIAADFDISAEEIMAINRLKHTRLAPGRYLFLPQRPADSAAATITAYIPPVNAYEEETYSDVVVYRIKKGDCISKIARRFHVSRAQICRWNQLAIASTLRPGRTLIVRPASAEEAVEAFVPATRTIDSKALYVVQSGDTPYSIARRAGVKMSDLLAWNHIDSLQPSIRAGDSLRLTVPLRASVAVAGEEPAEPADLNDSSSVADQSDKAGTLLYTVRCGDNLYSISRKFSIPLQILLSFNHLRRNSILRPGMTIVLPSAPEAAAPATSANPRDESEGIVYYKVRNGDTLPLIASAFGIPLEKLSRDNNLRPDSMVAPGEVIKVEKSRAP
jgi:membrane-bound lytic murein transglycosylase D